MDVKKKKIDNIRENILEVLESTEKALELFKDERITKNRNVDYDFDDFSDLDLFVQIEKENIEKLQSFDCRLKFNNIKMHLNETMKILINKQQVIYDEFIEKFNNLTNEIHATSSVSSFLGYWNEKHCDNFELKEYPTKFLQCLENVPNYYRLQIEKDLFDIKRFPDIYNRDNDKTISSKISESNDNSQLNEIKNIKTEISQNLLFDDSTFNDDTMLRIQNKNTNFLRGNTAKLNISVLDYTVNCCNEVPFPSKPSPYLEHSFDSEILAGSDDDNDNDLLNQAVHEKSEDEDVILSGSHGFLNSGDSKGDTSDSSYPEKENWYPRFEDDVTFNMTMEVPVDMSEIQDSSKFNLNDSQSQYDERSDSETHEEDHENNDLSKLQDSTDFSFMDTSKFTLGYSFNNNSNLKLQRFDDDD